MKPAEIERNRVVITQAKKRLTLGPQWGIQRMHHQNTDIVSKNLLTVISFRKIRQVGLKALDPKVS